MGVPAHRERWRRGQRPFQDLLDPHRGDHLPQLAKDDVAGLLLEFQDVQTQQTDGGVLHHIFISADGHGEDARHVDADVLDGERTLEGNLDLDRIEVEVGIVLDERDHEGGTAVDAPCRVAAAGLAVDHQHPVRGAALVAPGNEEKQAEQDRRRGNGADQGPRSTLGVIGSEECQGVHE